MLGNFLKHIFVQYIFERKQDNFLPNREIKTKHFNNSKKKTFQGYKFLNIDEFRQGLSVVEATSQSEIRKCCSNNLKYLCKEKYLNNKLYQLKSISPK